MDTVIECSGFTRMIISCGIPILAGLFRELVTRDKHEEWQYIRVEVEVAG